MRIRPGPPPTAASREIGGCHLPHWGEARAECGFAGAPLPTAASRENGGCHLPRPPAGEVNRIPQSVASRENGG